MPKLIPLPTTIGARNAVARFRWPMLRNAKAKVTSAPTVSTPSSAATGAAAPKNSSRPSATIAVVKMVARTIPPSSA